VPAAGSASQGEEGFPLSYPIFRAQIVDISLQVFKWEERKGWDVLLAAYLEEFAAASPFGGGGSEAPPVALYLLTQPYHSTSDFATKMHAWATENLGVLGALRATCCGGIRSSSIAALRLHATLAPR